LCYNKLSKQGTDMTKAEIKRVIEQAIENAKFAADEMISQNPNVWFPCGFASVNIKPGRGPFVTVLKEMGLGRADSYYGGYTVNNPSENLTQWMDAKVAGASAFAATLREHGVMAYVTSRID
jgi:hypothetical protein